MPLIHRRAEIVDAVRFSRRWSGYPAACKKGRSFIHSDPSGHGSVPRQRAAQ